MPVSRRTRRRKRDGVNLPPSSGRAASGAARRNRDRLKSGIRRARPTHQVASGNRRAAPPPAGTTNSPRLARGDPERQDAAGAHGAGSAGRTRRVSDRFPVRRQARLSGLFRNLRFLAGIEAELGSGPTSRSKRRPGGHRRPAGRVSRHAPKVDAGSCRRTDSPEVGTRGIGGQLVQISTSHLRHPG